MIAIIIEDNDKDCPHRSRVYQPEEPDTNVKESYTCDDCGAELEIPEPDWDLLYKEK